MPADTSLERDDVWLVAAQFDVFDRIEWETMREFAGLPDRPISKADVVVACRAWWHLPDDALAAGYKLIKTNRMRADGLGADVVEYLVCRNSIKLEKIMSSPFMSRDKVAS